MPVFWWMRLDLVFLVGRSTSGGVFWGICELGMILGSLSANGGEARAAVGKERRTAPPRGRRKPSREGEGLCPRALAVATVATARLDRKSVV